MSFYENRDKYELNILNLNFKSTSIEKKFRKAYFDKSLLIFRIAFIIVTILYILFGYLDTIVAKTYAHEFLFIRFVIVVPLFLFVFISSYLKVFRKVWQEALMLSFIVSGTGIIYMLMKIPDNLLYYGGLFLVFMAGFFFIRLRFLAAAISGLSLIAIYNIAILITKSENLILTNSLFISNSFYISSVIIGMFALYYIEKLERKEFQQHEILIAQHNEILKINSNLEQQVIERTAEIQHKNTELKSEKEKAEESDRLKTAFLQNMSHEIRTPLNAISGFSSLLNNPELSEEKRKSFVSIIQNSSGQLISIVSNILTISSLETKQEKLTINKVCINEIIVELLAIFKNQSINQNIALYAKQQLTDKQSEIYSDKTKITQILSNLISNALKFTHEGFIEFGYILKNNELEFYVKDSGIGIKPEFHAKIFERFRQAEKSINKLYGGTGLGLAISKAFTELLGGRIWVQSEHEKGSTFYFAIPYKTLIEIDKTSKPVRQNENFKTVLVAEDEEFNYLFIEELLLDSDIKLIHAKDGKETVEMCKSNPDINLVLMDIKMPIMDGYEATKIIKEFCPNLPIIAQSAYALEHEIEQYGDVFDDYLTKPINGELLIKKVNKYIKQK